MNDDPKQTPAPVGDEDTSAEQLADSSKHAADVTREQIKHIYESNPPNVPEGKQPPKSESERPEEPKSQSPYARTHKKDFDWREYHSAWQTYYQEYYRRYYHHLNSKKSLQEGEKPDAVVGDDSERVEALKKDVVTQVKRHATKIKRSHHFWPLITAAVVGVSFLFVQFNSIVFAQVGSYVSPGALEGQKLIIPDPTGSTKVGPEPRLIIPKINVDVPVNFDITTTDEHTIQNALQDGAVHYKLPGAGALPGQYGNSVILGHSSNDVFAKGQYKFAFVLTDQLVVGDTFYVNYNSTRYTYKVTDKRVIKPQELDALQIGDSKPMLTLVTCTPAGTSINRLLVFAEQINPDPASATQAAPDDATAGNQQIPGNAPTLLEQFWSLFF
jgi:sortase A